MTATFVLLLHDHFNFQVPYRPITDFFFSQIKPYPSHIYTALIRRSIVLCRLHMCVIVFQWSDCPLLTQCTMNVGIIGKMIKWSAVTPPALIKNVEILEKGGKNGIGVGRHISGVGEDLQKVIRFDNYP